MTKLKWFVRRFGWAEVFRKPIRALFAPLTIPFLSNAQFAWNGKLLSPFFHRYNVTWAGERMVEIPIIRTYIEGCFGRNILEVGNVLSHYGLVNHLIVDKYEKAPEVLNLDVLDYRPETLFDLIVSISTFEHIGFDDDAAGSSREKILAAIDHCRSLLSEDGVFVITVPLGYNPDLDSLISSGEIRSTSVSYLYRFEFSKWRQTDYETAVRYPYRHLFPYANSLAVIEFGKRVCAVSG